MLVELKAKSQVTIPKDILTSVELNQGDQFEVIENNGKIVLVLVAIYPEHVIKILKVEVKERFHYLFLHNYTDSIISHYSYISI